MKINFIVYLLIPRTTAILKLRINLKTIHVAVELLKRVSLQIARLHYKIVLQCTAANQYLPSMSNQRQIQVNK